MVETDLNDLSGEPIRFGHSQVSMFRVRHTTATITMGDPQTLVTITYTPSGLTARASLPESTNPNSDSTLDPSRSRISRVWLRIHKFPLCCVTQGGCLGSLGI